MRDIDSLLRRNDPAADTPDYLPQQRQRILAGALTGPPPRRREVRIGAVAATLALVAGLGYTNLTDFMEEARADDVLTEAAIRAVDPETRADQYWKITTGGQSTISGEGGVCIVEIGRVEYVAVDGTRPSWYVDEPAKLVRQVTGEGDCAPSWTEREAWTMNVSPADAPTESWQVPTPQFLAALPRDVDALRGRLYADTAGKGRDPDSEVHVYVADVLRSGLVPADLRSALFRVLTTVPGIGVSDELTVEGREVVVIGIEDSYGYTEELLIDPVVGEVVGERDRVEMASFRPRLELLTTISREVVDEIPEDVSAIAEHRECSVEPDGAVICDG